MTLVFMGLRLLLVWLIFKTGCRRKT